MKRPRRFAPQIGFARIKLDKPATFLGEPRKHCARIAEPFLFAPDIGLDLDTPRLAFAAPRLLQDTHAGYVVLLALGVVAAVVAAHRWTGPSGGLRGRLEAA